MGGTAAGVLTLNEVRTRTKLIKVGRHGRRWATSS